MSGNNKVYTSDRHTYRCGFNDHYHHQQELDEFNEGDNLPHVSVIVCSHRYDCQVESLLCILSRQLLVKLQLVLVTDEQILVDVPDNVVCLVNEGIGLSCARNTGIKHACGDYIAFIDDDAKPHTRIWLRTLVYMCDKLGADVIGGPVIPHTCVDIPTYLMWVIGCTVPGFDRPIGCNMLFKSYVFRQHNFRFKSTLGKHAQVSKTRVSKTCTGNTCTYETCGNYVSEETDLFNRMRQAGFKVVTVEQGSVIHMVKPHRLTWRYLINRSIVEGRSKYHAGTGTSESRVVHMILKQPSLKGLVALACAAYGYLYEHVYVHTRENKGEGETRWYVKS